jgi:HKD family nuclease
MKMITTSKILEKEFKRLISTYREFFWATAWASSSTTIFNELVSRKRQIKKIIVGIHFYQTHPDFIEAFVNNDRVHFIQQPDGTFHPKVYLFYNSDDEWEVIIGSANFTNSAFNKNTEASILISNKDNDSKTILTDTKNLIEKSWNEGKTFNNIELNNYRLTWRNQQAKIKSLSGKYGSNKKIPIPIYNVAVANRTWRQYIDRINNEGAETLNHRLTVINLAHEIFEDNNHFHTIGLEERKFIAGIPNHLENDGNWLWGVFGSMKGAGIFKNRIIENDINISLALGKIPSVGTVTKKQYDNYIELFQSAFIGTQLENANNLATATRLLSMKRPDTFVCLDSKNKSELCRDFGIIQSEMNFERYWEDIVLRIYDCNWWINPDPKNDIEEKISMARAAFLDSLYYEE